MQRPGFNVECRDNIRARWGYCANCANQPCQVADSDDADASIGIGLGMGRMEVGAGWTRDFAAGKNKCNGPSSTFRRIWVSVRKA